MLSQFTFINPAPLPSLYHRDRSCSTLSNGGESDVSSNRKSLDGLSVLGVGAGLWLLDNDVGGGVMIVDGVLEDVVAKISWISSEVESIWIYESGW